MGFHHKKPGEIGYSYPNESSSPSNEQQSLVGREGEGVDGFIVQVSIDAGGFRGGPFDHCAVQSCGEQPLLVGQHCETGYCVAVLSQNSLLGIKAERPYHDGPVFSPRQQTAHSFQKGQVPHSSPRSPQLTYFLQSFGVDSCHGVPTSCFDPSKQNSFIRRKGQRLNRSAEARLGGSSLGRNRVPGQEERAPEDAPLPATC